MALGMIGRHTHDKLYDVAVVGARPCGTRHRGVRRSEGPVGGRCSMRARSAARPAPARGSKTISDFPTGISGQALAGRAFVQAQKFGARDADTGRR